MFNVVFCKDISKSTDTIRVESNPNTNPNDIKDLLWNSNGYNISESDCVDGREGPVETRDVEFKVCRGIVFKISVDPVWVVLDKS